MTAIQFHAIGKILNAEQYHVSIIALVSVLCRHCVKLAKTADVRDLKLTLLMGGKTLNEFC